MKDREERLEQVKTAKAEMAAAPEAGPTTTPPSQEVKPAEGPPTKPGRTRALTGTHNRHVYNVCKQRVNVCILLTDVLIQWLSFHSGEIDY